MPCFNCGRGGGVKLREILCLRGSIDVVRFYRTRKAILQSELITEHIAAAAAAAAGRKKRGKSSSQTANAFLRRVYNYMRDVQ